MATVDKRILDKIDPEAEAHLAMIQDEFRRGFAAVDEIPRPAVTLFGSARVSEGEAAYDQARECGRLLAEAGFAVSIPVNGTVARYRVSFRDSANHPIAHVDHRSAPVARNQ